MPCLVNHRWSSLGTKSWTRTWPNVSNYKLYAPVPSVCLKIMEDQLTDYERILQWMMMYPIISSRERYLQPCCILHQSHCMYSNLVIQTTSVYWSATLSDWNLQMIPLRNVTTTSFILMCAMTRMANKLSGQTVATNKHLTTTESDTRWASS